MYGGFSTNKKQVILISGYLLALVSIPTGFAIVKQTHLFDSGLGSKDISLIDDKIGGREVPSSSLDDLKSQLEASNSNKPKPTSSPSSSVSFGPTLSFKVSLEGRPTTYQAARIFIGLASGTAQTKPSYILSFSVDVPSSGSFSGLSLAGLTSGSTYTAYLKGPGQIDSAATFTMSPSESVLNNSLPVLLLSGDVNEDNTVNSADYTIVRDQYGFTPNSSGWNTRADFNADNIINSWDLTYVNKNTGKIGASGIWYSKPPSSSGSAEFKDGSGGYDASPNGSFSSPPTSGYWLFVPN